MAQDKDPKSEKPKSAKLEPAKPEAAEPEPEKPKKKKELKMVPHPEEDEDISSEMNDLFDEESVKHQHGHAEPEGD
ncbi:MAG TPA: hypothetical protein VGJ57_12120 [Nitrospirales bacterium]